MEAAAAPAPATATTDKPTLQYSVESDNKEERLMARRNRIAARNAAAKKCDFSNATFTHCAQHKPNDDHISISGNLPRAETRMRWLRRPSLCWTARRTRASSK